MTQDFTSIPGLLAFDREHLWHPYTSMTSPLTARLVTSAEGVRLTFVDGTTAIDAMSSWWAAIHGYRHPTLDAAASAQLGAMSHVMFGGLTHEPAIRLGAALLSLAPDGLEHVFFADSGSVSVEVALKMALQYQRGVGHPERTKMLALAGGYHGDTFAAMSMCDPVGGMHSMFSDVVMPAVFADRPPAPGCDVDAWASGFRAVAHQHATMLAGIIVEPVLQGAGGMHAYDARCLQVMRDVADELGLVLIFDEIATGFARTGPMFAAHHAGVSPDIMCVGKALTGGYLTLAATLCTTTIAHGISASESGVLNHGPTFMANPLACAIASANLELLTSTEWAANIRRIHAELTCGLAPAADLPGVVDVRTLGAVGVIELDHPVDVAAATSEALAHGVWIRPFRNLIYTMPPYVTTDAELETVTAAMVAAVKVS